MNFLISLAMKNLSRYHRRTIITASAIAIGIGVYIFMDAWVLGMKIDSERNLRHYESSTVRLMASDYWEDRKYFPLDVVVERPEELTSALGAEGIAATARVSFGAELIAREGSLRVKASGVDPNRDMKVFDVEKTISEGRWLRGGEAGAIIGSWLAQDLDIAPGDSITLRMKTRYGAFQAIDLEIVGIADTPNPAVNRGLVMIPIDVADMFLQMDGAVTEIDCRAGDLENTDEYRAKVRRIVAGRSDLDLRDWREIGADALMASAGDEVETIVLLFLIAIISAVGVSNTMLMSVFERLREIGMMRALGMRDREIVSTFMAEAAGIGALGAAGGLVIGSILTFWIVNWGVDMGTMNVAYRITGLFRGAWHPSAMIVAAIVSIIFSLIIAYFPASRALRSEITDCLRRN